MTPVLFLSTLDSLLASTVRQENMQTISPLRPFVLPAYLENTPLLPLHPVQTATRASTMSSNLNLLALLVGQAAILPWLPQLLSLTAKIVRAAKRA